MIPAVGAEGDRMTEVTADKVQNITVKEILIRY